MDHNTVLWTRSYILNNLVCFIINVSYYMLMVIMTDYASHQLHGTLSEAGFATGSFIIGALLARFFMGGRIERIGLKKSAYLGIFIFLAALMANFFTTTIAQLSLVRLIQGFGFGTGSTTTGAIMAHIVPSSRRGEGTSYYAMFVTLATAIGPYAGAYFYRGGSLQEDIFISGSLLIIALIATALMKVPALEWDKNAEKSREQNQPLWIKFLEPTAIPIAVITLLVSLGFASILTFVTSFEALYDLQQAGQYFFVVYAIFTLVSRPFTGRLFDKKGANFVLYPSFLVFAAGLLLLSLTNRGWELLLVAAALGIGFGTYMSCAQAVVIMLSPKNRIGVATSTFFIFMDLGVGLGPSAMGLIIPYIGFRGLYLFMACILGLCLFLYIAFCASHTRPAPASSQAVPAPAGSPAGTEKSPALIITISREYGSGGHEIGQRIAENLQIPCYDQQIIGKIAETSESTRDFVAETEQRLKRPFLYRLYSWYAYSITDGADFLAKLFDMDKKIITDIAQKGSCVIVGRLAHQILKNYPNALHIYISAAEDSEIQHVTQRDHISPEKAKEKIRRINQERAAHCQYFTHTHWGEAKNYDLTIRSDLFGIGATADILTQLARRRLLPGKTKE